MQFSGIDQADSFPVQDNLYQAKHLYDTGKRLLETSVAVLLLVALSPLWIAVALAIKLTSAGPVFYKGQVIGKHGREFTYYKFRSMGHNNDNSGHRRFIATYVQSHSNPATEEGASFKLGNDNRVTKIGKIIR